MFEMISDGLTYLGSLDTISLVALFWFTILFDLPRYGFAFLSVILANVFAARSRGTSHFQGRVSVVVAGHNEAASIETCVRSLREQSRPPDEIIVVSDGSSDGMPAKLRELQGRGLIQQAHSTDLRAGKSAATNLAARTATGDIVINVDCDCSYDRHALKRIVAPFEDPAIGAVSGNILVRNARASLVATFQAIEYLISISLGKQASNQTDQVTCVSGAFGAFRRTAFESVGGIDVGGGEDLDITMRLRKAGWKILFVPESICYTAVPDTLTGLIKQRFRWERDAVRLRYRKHLSLMNPFAREFRLSEVLHEVEFFVFHVLSAAVLPFYIIWVFLAYGDLAITILIAAQAGLMVLDMLAFVLAALAPPRARCLGLLPFVVCFGIFNGLLMRFVRLAAYMQEWLFNASAFDSYVPEKVLMLRRW